jgi:hypothetical protein
LELRFEKRQYRLMDDGFRKVDMPIPQALYELLTGPMLTVGLVSVEKATFALERVGNSSMQYVVLFDAWGAKQANLSAVIGFGDIEADSFAVRSLQRHGGSVYRSWSTDCTWRPIIRVSVGNKVNWGARDALSWRTIGRSALEKHLVDDIKGLLVQIVEMTGSRKGLLDLLMGDSSLLPWSVTSAPARAAQIVYLALAECVDVRAVREHLRVREVAIKAQSPEMGSASRFLDAIEVDARLAIESRRVH